MIDLTGQQFGTYRLIRHLGSGGFASVYLVQHIRIDTQQAAIKVLHLTQVDTQKFQQEAKTSASLRHRHIVRLFDFDIQQGTPFLVMDYASNGSLHKRHSSGEQVPLAVLVLYVNRHPATPPSRSGMPAVAPCSTPTLVTLPLCGPWHGLLMAAV